MSNKRLFKVNLNYIKLNFVKIKETKFVIEFCAKFILINSFKTSCDNLIKVNGFFCMIQFMQIRKHELQVNTNQYKSIKTIQIYTKQPVQSKNKSCSYKKKRIMSI